MPMSWKPLVPSPPSTTFGSNFWSFDPPLKLYLPLPLPTTSHHPSLTRVQSPLPSFSGWWPHHAFVSIPYT